MDHDYDETENVDLYQIHVGGNPVMTVGVSESGLIFIRGDLHPLGSSTALLKAAVEHVPYIAVTAVEVLFPAEWLRAECAHDADRLRIIWNIESMARSGFSQGSGVRA